jgi:hypothetical protein
MATKEDVAFWAMLINGQVYLAVGGLQDIILGGLWTVAAATLLIYTNRNSIKTR